MKTFSATLACLILLLLGSSSEATAQISIPNFISIDTTKAPEPLSSAFRLDYIVPDAPAFSLIGVDQSNILRPATIREFAASLTSFTGGTGFSIPKTFSVEFAPGLLIGGKNLTLADYRKNPLNWIRVSAATKRLSGAEGPSEIAFGLRFSVRDKADPRRNDVFLLELDSLNQKALDILISLPPQVQQVLPSGVEPGSSAFFNALPDSIKTLVQTRFQTLDAEREALIQQALANSSETWNNSAIDLATAIRFSTADSLGKDIRATDIAAWLTFGTKIKSWGQVLFGFKGSMARDTSMTATDNKFKGEGSAGLRLYIGTNQYKMFTETQLESTHMTGDRVETLLLNGGGEARLRNGTWIEFGGGIEYNFMTKQWDVVSKFSVKVGLPFLVSIP